MKVTIKKRTLKWAGIVLAVLIIVGGIGMVMMKPKRVVLHTTSGDITIELASDMPITAGNFEKLVNSGFYDGTRFHRVIANFMIQGGDPNSKDVSKASYWGTGDAGYKIKDEFTNHNKNARGTISMANAGPNTGGSQFFISLVDNNYLDSKHPVFGKVVSGMDIVDKIGNVATDPRSNRPLQDVVITKAEMI